MIVGDGGLGKGTLSIDLAARLSRGDPFPQNEARREPGNTLLVVSAEDDVQRTVVPRLLAAEADMCRIFTPPEDALVSLPESVEGLEAFIVRHKIAFLVIDPLNAYMSGRLNVYKDTDVRQALTPLKHMAERQRVAALIVHHINRGVSTQASQRVSGSSGIRNAVRALYFVGADPDDDTPEQNRRVLANDKLNVGPRPPSLSFSIKTVNVQQDGVWYNDLPRLDWHGTSEHTPADLIAPMPTKAAEEGGARLEEAKSFYREYLADGERPSNEADAERERRGIKLRTAKTARTHLGVVPRKKGNIWYISLPPTSEPASENEG